MEIKKQINDIFKLCEKRGYTLDGLIHCAGVCSVQEISEIKKEDIKHVYGVNTFSFVELCRLFFEYNNRAKDSRIIAVSSITADRPYRNQLVYSSSKAALNQIVLSMAQEGLLHGVKVNAVQLGAVDTKMFNSLNPNMQTITNHYPLGIMKADSVAEIIADLLTPKFKEMTGSIIKIDSGFGVVH